jgi:hypothetical protein
MKRSLALLLALAGISTAVQAGSILSDDFNYPDGAIVGAAGSPWQANSGNAGTATVTNNQLFVAGTSARSQDILALLSGNPYSTNVAATALYAKFTVKFVSPPTAVGTMYFAHFTGEGVPPNASNHRARINPNYTNLVTGVAASPGHFFLGIGNNSPSSGTPIGPAAGQWPTELATNVTYTVVSRYVPSTGISTMWIDPVTEASPSVTADDAPSLVNVAFYSFRQATSQGVMWIDGLRVGTAFADVAGANTAPTISSIPDQNIPRNGTTGPQPFTVGDAETLAPSLTVAKASTNLDLVPLSAITINDGDGTNRTVTVTPTTGMQGTTLVTLTVSDGVNTAQTTFRVTVGAPAISVIPNQIAISNVPIPAISFTVVDPEGDTLYPSASSSSQGLLQNANITFGGAGANRTVTLVPEPDTTGVTTVTISYNDGVNTASRSFVLSVSPRVEPLLADNFSYTSWNFSPQSLYDAVGSPWQTVSGTAYQIQVTNGWAYFGATNSEDLAAPLAGGPYASTNGLVVYSSFTLRQTSLPVGAGTYFAHLKDSSTGSNFRAKVFVTTNGVSNNSFRIGIANSANVGTYFPLDCSKDTDYLVVTRYNSGTGESVLWVNPLSEASTGVPATDAPTTSPVGYFGLREDTATLSQGNLQISNLVVSTSFPSIPVPASITITSIKVVGSTVTVDFTAGASDAAAAFDLLGATLVNSTYGATGATITSPSAGNFEATTSTSGDTQFYRIKRK